MDITTALTSIELLLAEVKEGQLRAETLNYEYVKNRQRFVVSTGKGFLTYLEVYNDDGSSQLFFESFLVQDPFTNTEDGIGDQWSPLIELSPEHQAHFRSIIATFRA
jgi:hypothetical protein